MAIKGDTHFSPLMTDDEAHLIVPNAFFDGASSFIYRTFSGTPAIAMDDGQVADIVLPSGGKTSFTMGLKFLGVNASGSTTGNLIEFRTLGGTVLHRFEWQSASSVLIAKTGNTVIGTGVQNVIGKMVEVHYVGNDTTGRSYLKVGGNDEFDATNVDTLFGTGPVEVIRIRWTGANGDRAAFFTMCYVHFEGSQPDFLGPARQIVRMPNGTVSNDLTLVGAATAHEALDDNPPDGDTTYIETNNDGDKAVLELEAFGDTGAILGVTPFGIAEHPAPGAGDLVFTITSDGNPSSPNALTPPDEAYGLLLDQTVRLDPDGGGAWDESQFDAARLEPEYSA